MTPNTLAFLGNLGGPDLLVIAIIGLLIFGKRLPEVGKNLGQAVIGFKKGLKDVTDDVREGTESVNLNTLTDPEPTAEKKSAPATPVKAATIQREKKLLRPASEEP